jgi:hypothetical protein
MLDLGLLPAKNENKILNLYYQCKQAGYGYSNRQIINEIDNILVGSFI